MARCSACECPISDDRERVGARCPSCHEPLYEPATRIARSAREDEASCLLHVGMEAVGVCSRCGNYVCETCRTRWQGLVHCPACLVNLRIDPWDTTKLVDASKRHAFLSLACAGFAWLTAVAALLALPWFQRSTLAVGVTMTFLIFLLVQINVLVAAFGTGQALTVLRRQIRSPLAWVGLLACGLYSGVMLGLMALVLWQQ